MPGEFNSRHSSTKQKGMACSLAAARLPWPPLHPFSPASVTAAGLRAVTCCLLPEQLICQVQRPSNRTIVLLFIKTLNPVFAALDMYDGTRCHVPNWTTYHAETNAAATNQCIFAVGRNKWLAAIRKWQERGGATLAPASPQNRMGASPPASRNAARRPFTRRAKMQGNGTTQKDSPMISFSSSLVFCL